MDNSHKKKRFPGRILSFFLAAALVLSGAPAGLLPGSQTQDISTVEAAQTSSASNAEKYGLAENIEDGAILHCWCWSFNTIRENMKDIAEAGFSTVQTSPANTCNDTHPNMKIMGNDTEEGTDGCWWWHYQPTDWKIGNYQLGTRDDFIAMCEEADKYGIKVIVDVIPNHVTPDLDEVSQDLYDAVGGRDNLFHANGFNPIVNWGNRLECTTGEMGGLPDVNTENPAFQKYFLNYLNDLIECGADGFRYDTAKHIGVPSDPTDPKSERNNFWPVVTGKESVDGVSLKDAARIFTYGEVLQGDNVPETEYAQYMRMTASSYGYVLRSAVQNKNFSVNNIMNWQHSSPDSLVTWVESHDTYCNAGESTGLSKTQIRLAWAVIAARADGTPLFYSRPNNSDGWNNRWGDNVIGNRGDSEFMSTEVAAVNKFRNAMAGEKEYLRNINDSSQILQIDRGTSGTCIINLGGAVDINTKTNLKDGTYEDQVSGRTFTVTNGMIKGHLDGEKVAVIYNPSVTVESVSAQSATGSETFSTDTLDVTLKAKNVTDAQYTTSEGDSGSYEDGDVITVGSTLSEGESVTVTVSAKGSEGTVTDEAIFTKVGKNIAYIDLPSGWDEPYIYVYNEAGAENAAWPGVKMEKVEGGLEGYSNPYYYEVPDTISDPLVIFYGGDNSRRYPADMEDGLPLTGSMIYTAPGNWNPIIIDPVVKPEITSSLKTGSTFDDESADVTLTLKNATSGTYSLDGGPVQTFEDKVTVTVGKGKIADSDITLEVTATDGKVTTEKTFTFHKEFNEKKNGGYIEYETGADAEAQAEVSAVSVSSKSASSAAMGGKYATNPNGNLGQYATITGAEDFTEDMLIAQGAANDDPRIFRGSHEGPVYDDYALYGAWDDENLYIGWQYVNVTDVVDPAQGYPISDNGKPYNGDIPQILAFNLGTGNDCDGSLDTGGYVWGINVGYETPIDAMICFSSKPGVGTPALFTASEDGTFSYDTCVGLKDAGISYSYEDGFFCGDTLTGIKGNGYDGYVPSMVESSSSNWVNFLNEGHSTSQDTFYTMTIPLESLGITRSQLESRGIEVMHISTFGESGIGSVPMDMTMLDNATEEYSADASTSAEKEDTDMITVPLAQLGAEGTGSGSGSGSGTPSSGKLSVNFGADLSSPQTDETDLTLEAKATGGEGTLTYQFLVDGEAIQNSTDSKAEWNTTGGDHTIAVVVTDSEGHQVTVEKEYEIIGEVVPPVDKLTVTSFTAAKVSPQPVGTTVKLTAEAKGGEGDLQYRFYRESSDGKTTVFCDYQKWNTAYCNPAAGTYTLYVEVKDSAGNTATASMDYTWIEEGEAPVINSVKANKQSPQAQGTTVMLTVDAEGEGDLQYRFYRVSADGKTTVFRDYQKWNTAYCNPTAGTYKIYVDVKDGNGNIATESLDYTWTAKSGEKPVIKSIAVSKESPQTQGTTVKFTVSAEGQGQLQYRFYREMDQNVTVFRDYSTSRDAYCNPSVPGTYTVYVDVKDENGNVTTESMEYTWGEAGSPIVINSFTASKQSPQALGSTVLLKVNAEGGDGNLQYRFYRVGNGKTTVFRDYSSSNEAYCNPPESGSYFLYVDVKDGSGAVETYKMVYEWK